MSSNYNPTALSSTSKTFLQEKFSSRALAQFIATMRVKRGPRGELLTLIRTIVSVPTCPSAIAWADLYRMLSRRGASNQVIVEARILWSAFKSSIATVSPVVTTRRTSP